MNTLRWLCFFFATCCLLTSTATAQGLGEPLSPEQQRDKEKLQRELDSLDEKIQQMEAELKERQSSRDKLQRELDGGVGFGGMGFASQSPQEEAQYNAAFLHRFATMLEQLSQAGEVTVLESIGREDNKKSGRNEGETKPDARDLKKVDQWMFYWRPLELNAESEDNLLRIFSDFQNFRPHYSGGKFCGGFHPDFCIRWTDSTERDEYSLLVCLGCMEVHFLRPDGQFYFDCEPEAWKQLIRFAAEHGRHRKQAWTKLAEMVDDGEELQEK